MTLLNSIKSKIVVFSILATLIPSLGLGLLSFRQNEALISETVTRELRTLVSDADHEIELWLDRRMHEVRVSSTSNAVMDGLSAIARPAAKPRAGSGAGSIQALPHYLRSVKEKLDTLQELTVVNPEGRIVASSTQAPVAVKLPQEWSQDALTDGLVVVPPHWDEQYGAATLAVAIPVLSYDNLLLGALVAVLDLSTLQSHLKSATKSPPGNVLLLDADGKVLTSSYEDGKRLVSLESSVFNQLKAHPGESLFFKGMTKREVIGLADTSSELPITILAERDRGEVYDAWVKWRNMFLALVSGLAIVVAAVAFQMGRSIVRPLQKLMAAADRIADGDLEIRLTATRNDELGHLTRVFNEMAGRLRQNHAEIMAANQAMQQQNRVLETLSITDSLTGLYNRSKLDAILSDQLARFRRTQREFTLLMMDIDHFKTLNDTYGHLTGDEVLAAVAQILSQSIRSIDYAARYGGDEFIIILVETSAAQALKTAERICNQVEGMVYNIDGSSIAVTVSIGIVQCQPEDETPTAVLARADMALYEAKRAGRNRAHYGL